MRVISEHFVEICLTVIIITILAIVAVEPNNQALGTALNTIVPGFIGYVGKGLMTNNNPKTTNIMPDIVNEK